GRLEGSMSGSRVVTAGLACLFLFAIAGCRRPSTDDSGRPAAVTVGTGDMYLLEIGETVRASVKGDEPLICTYTEAHVSAEGPCRRFHVHPADPGALGVRLTWDTTLPLRLDLRSVGGAALSTACCTSPLELTTRVETGGAYYLDVILLTPWGESQAATFEI